MNTPSRIFLLILCGAVVAVALGSTRSQSHATDLRTAINIARTARFGPGNDARIDVWIKKQKPGAKLQWRGVSRGVLEREVPLTLEVHHAGASTRYLFKVTIEPRALLPDDAPARELLLAVRKWATSR